MQDVYFYLFPIEGGIRRISKPLFLALARGEARLPEYAGNEQRVAQVIVAQEATGYRLCDQAGLLCGHWSFDGEGRLEVGGRSGLRDWTLSEMDTAWIAGALALRCDAFRAVETDGGVNQALTATVGIFWVVGADGESRTLLTDRSALAAAEIYGDFLTHPHGHYDIWEQLRALPVVARRKRRLPAVIGSEEYETFPRGRIVYHARAKVFVLYADRRLQAPDVISVIRHWFGLGAEVVVVRSDAHYRTSVER
jgi:hypothetical protein